MAKAEYRYGWVLSQEVPPLPPKQDPLQVVGYVFRLTRSFPEQSDRKKRKGETCQPIGIFEVLECLEVAPCRFRLQGHLIGRHTPGPIAFVFEVQNPAGNMDPDLEVVLFSRPALGELDEDCARTMWALTEDLYHRIAQRYPGKRPEYVDPAQVKGLHSARPWIRDIFR
jgi:hypothetical protein